MKKHLLVLATICLGLVFVGCSASIKPQNLFSSSFSRPSETTEQKTKDNFEQKAFKTPEGVVLSYKFLRPIGEDSRTSYPLILVLSEKNHVGAYLQELDFQTVYPAYVVIPDFETLPELSQLLVLLGASLNVDRDNTYLLSEEKIVKNAFELLGQFPLSFTTVVLVDIPLLKYENLNAVLKNRFFLFANKNRKKISDSMSAFEKAVINYGGKATSVKVDPKEGKIAQQVYEDQEFWLRVFNLTP